MTNRVVPISRRCVLAACLAAPLATRRAHAAMPTITDAVGRRIALKAPAERIVLGFNYEEFTAVAGPAGWDRVVGFAKALWSDWRPSVFKRYSVPIPRLATLADVGNTDDNTFSMEKVLSLRPDLVILAEWSFSVLRPQVEQLEALGIPVMVIDYNAEIPERHVASTIGMGIATGNEERARELAALYTAKLADIARRTADVTGKPKVYLELGQGGADVVGNTYWKGMWGRLLDMAAAENIAAGRIPGNYAPLSPEYVLAANPDAIFIAGSSWVGRPNAVVTGFDADVATTRARLAPYARRQGWQELTAIRNGQLFAMEHGLCRALFDYTATYFIAKAIYPTRFADIDPVGELRRYHEQYLPVPFEGIWMTRLEPLPA
ncbi:MAG TPA: ABC transporter substrate-binding protein [Acetobacteraceae bacterium]|nr:ABC transporter substrate-binding protein [Acetobacteraceae bacterium]